MSKPILVLSFGPFAGRNTNGSTTVARELARRYSDRIEHQILPVTWAAVREAGLSALNQYDFAVGLGEGFPHAVTVERFAFDWPREQDNNRQPPPVTLLEGGLPFLETDICDLAWGNRRDTVSDELVTSMGYRLGHPGIIPGSFAGYGQCNALLYYLLKARHNGEGRGCGFIHLPPQEGWQTRTGRNTEEYASAFTDVVKLVLSWNSWLT